MRRIVLLSKVQFQNLASNYNDLTALITYKYLVIQYQRCYQKLEILKLNGTSHISLQNALMPDIKIDTDLGLIKSDLESNRI